jgi:hypothetical protein
MGIEGFKGMKQAEKLQVAAVGSVGASSRELESLALRSRTLSGGKWNGCAISAQTRRLKDSQWTSMADAVADVVVTAGNHH